jgi:hypothetical protein
MRCDSVKPEPHVAIAEQSTLPSPPLRGIKCTMRIECLEERQCAHVEFVCAYIFFVFPVLDNRNFDNII